METFSALLAHCGGNPSVTAGLHSQKPVVRALMFSLIGAWTNGWANNRNPGDLRRHRDYHDVTVRKSSILVVLGCFGRYVTDGNMNGIFVNVNAYISTKISLKWDSGGLIYETWENVEMRELIRYAIYD